MFNSVVGVLVWSGLSTVSVGMMIWLTEDHHGGNPFRKPRELGLCWVAAMSLLPVNYLLLPTLSELFGPLAYFGMILIHGVLLHWILRQGWLKSCWWAVGSWGILGVGFLLAMLVLGRYGLGVW